MQFTSILVDWMYIQKAIEIGQPTIKTGEPILLVSLISLMVVANENLVRI